MGGSQSASVLLGVVFAVVYPIVSLLSAASDRSMVFMLTVWYPVSLLSWYKLGIRVSTCDTSSGMLMPTGSSGRVFMSL